MRLSSDDERVLTHVADILQEIRNTEIGGDHGQFTALEFTLIRELAQHRVLIDRMIEIVERNALILRRVMDQLGM